MKKILAVLLCCTLMFCSAFTVSAAYGDWRDYYDNVDDDLDDYDYNEWDDDWDDYSYGATTQISAPDIKLGGKSIIFDEGVSRYEEYAVEFIVSGGAASVSDIVVYNDGSRGDASEFDTSELPSITLERITLEEEFSGLGEQEKRSRIGRYPLKLGRNADGVGSGDVEYILGATGLSVTLQPGAYVVSVTPKDGSYSDPFGLTGWMPAVCFFGKGNIDEFDSSMTDSARLALIKSIEGGRAYQEAYDSASWESATEETARIAAAIEEEKRKAAELASRPITLKVDGKVIPTDSPPVIEDGRVLVPARALADALGGYRVDWDPINHIVSIISKFNDEPVLEMEIDSTTAYARGTGVDGTVDLVPVHMDVPAKIINGRTMIPARFVAERLYCDVSWDAATRTVVVESTQ